MWTCSKCSQRVDDHFELCWKCGTSVDGIEDPSFFADAEDDSGGERLPAVPDGERPDGERPERLVTVASCGLPAEALAMRLKLENAGIPVFLADEYTVAMDWLLSNAIGGIKVQVPEPSALQALQILGQPIPQDEETVADEDEENQADEDEEEGSQENERKERPEDY